MKMKISTGNLTRYFFLLTVAMLVIFGIGSLLRISAKPDQAFLYGFYAFAMFGDALTVLICLWMMNKRMKFAFEASVFVLGLNILLTIFDQFGVVDLLFVLLNLAGLAALIKA
jgi:FtsH-binding integral membrane protein